MATRTFYATKDMKNPNYGTRMLKAGDPVELDGPKGRLYQAIGAVTTEKPKRAKPVEEAVVPAMTTDGVEKPKPARKRTARRKK